MDVAWHFLWASYQIRKIAGWTCAGNAGRVTRMPWCMSGSLIHGGWANVPDILGACAKRNFKYLVRGPLGRFVYIYQCCSVSSWMIAAYYIWSLRTILSGSLQKALNIIHISFCVFGWCVMLLDSTNVLHGCFTGTVTIIRLPPFHWKNHEDCWQM